MDPEAEAQVRVPRAPTLRRPKWRSSCADLSTPGAAGAISMSITTDGRPRLTSLRDAIL